VFGSIGIFELVVIAGVALVALGPEKFPEFAKMAARFLRDIRKYGAELQEEIGKELKPMQDEFRNLQKVDPEKYIESLIDEDDESINLEPSPEDIDFYPPSESATDAPGDESGLGEDEPEPVTYGSRDRNGEGEDEYPREEDGYPEGERPERLDG